MALFYILYNKRTRLFILALISYTWRVTHDHSTTMIT